MSHATVWSVGTQHQKVLENLASSAHSKSLSQNLLGTKWCPTLQITSNNRATSDRMLYPL